LSYTDLMATLCGVEPHSLWFAARRMTALPSCRDDLDDGVGPEPPEHAPALRFQRPLLYRLSYPPIVIRGSLQGR